MNALGVHATMIAAAVTVEKFNKIIFASAKQSTSGAVMRFYYVE